MIKGNELGLKQLADQEIDARISFTGSERPTPVPPAKKKQVTSCRAEALGCCEGRGVDGQ
jgi:hypothetical protein